MCYASFVVFVETQAELFTLYLGDRLDLSCSAKDSLSAVNWTKDNVAVVDGEHTRIRNGQLVIETVELMDSGLYTCTTFGNHSLYFNVTGKVKETEQILFVSLFFLMSYAILFLPLNSHILSLYVFKYYVLLTKYSVDLYIRNCLWPHS